MSKGIVVDHKETGVRYAISEHNFNDKIHKHVRDLKPGETVRGFQPKLKTQPEDEGEQKLPTTPNPADVANTTPHTDSTLGAEKTEGSASAGSKGNK